MARVSAPGEGRRPALNKSFDLSSLLGEFRDEAREQLDRLDGALLAIEEKGAIPADEVTALLRSLHTLKGNSGMLGLRPLSEAVHAIEGVFKEQQSEFPRDRLDLLFEAAAALRQGVEQAGTAAQEEAFGRLSRLQLSPRLESSVGAAPETPPVAAPEEADSSMQGAPERSRPDARATSPASAEAEVGEAAGEFLRVPFAKLDQLLDQAGELTSVSAALRALLERYEDALQASGIGRELTEMAEQLARATRALRGSTMEARLVPVQRVFSRFPSLARDLAREQGKRVRVILEGGDVELDRSMVEALGDPLLHLVRNAVDHGIQPPEERTAAGRPATGTILLRAARQGDRVRVEVSDDGPGLDVEALRRTGQTLGLVGPHTQLTSAEAAELIFLPGFSTRAGADTVSGRGIGLDAVKQRVTALRGALSVESPAAGGTRFALDLPLTLAILPALVFEAEGGTFALPTVSIEGTVRGAVPERAGAAEVLRHQGELIPVTRAGSVFGWRVGTGGSEAAEPSLTDRGGGADNRRPARPGVGGTDLRGATEGGGAGDRPQPGSGVGGTDPGGATEGGEAAGDRDLAPAGERDSGAATTGRDVAAFAVVVRAGTRRTALIADRLLAQRDLVVKAIPGFLGRLPAVSGASVAPDGKVILLLDPAGLLDLNLALHRRENRAVTPP